MALLAFLGAIVRPFGGYVADRVTDMSALLVLLAVTAVTDFAIWIPPVAVGIALLMCLYLCFGFGNGSTFQLVPHRWKGKTGLLSGIVGTPGGIGGFCLSSWEWRRKAPAPTRWVSQRSARWPRARLVVS